jgi:hypothetical protein
MGQIISVIKFCNIKYSEDKIVFKNSNKTFFELIFNLSWLQINKNTKKNHRKFKGFDSLSHCSSTFEVFYKLLHKSSSLQMAHQLLHY